MLKDGLNRLARQEFDDQFRDHHKIAASCDSSKQVFGYSFILLKGFVPAYQGWRLRIVGC